MNESKADLHRYGFLLGLAGVALLAVIFWSIEMDILNPNFSYGDEGLVAESARRIFQGEVPYRDFFNPVTPGSYYFYALLFTLFGPTFFILRVGVILTAVMILAGTWWALQRFGVRRLTPYVMAAAYLAYYAGYSWFLASYHWLVLALCLFSLVYLLTDEEAPAFYGKMAVSGGFAALAAFTMQHKGGLWILAASIALLLTRPGKGLRALSWFWGGVLIVTLPLVVGFVLIVGWDSLIYDLIEFPLTQYHKMASHHGTILSAILKNWAGTHSTWLFRETFVDWVRIFAWHTGYLGQLVMFLLPILGSLALGALWRSRCLCKHKSAALTAFFIASYFGALHRPSDSTLVFAAPAAVLVIILYLYSSDSGVGIVLTKTRKWLVRCWLAVFVTVVIGYGLLGLLAPRVVTQTPAGPVGSTIVGHAKTIEGTMAFLRPRLQPGEKVFCYTYMAMFYFLLQADNPTPYDLLTYPMNTREQLLHARELLEADRTRWVIWDYLSPEGDPLKDYLARNYEIKARFKYAAIMERRAQ